MKVEEDREGIFTLTATTHEISLLIAGARMSLAMMRDQPSLGNKDPQRSLEKVLSDFDRAMKARQEEGH